VVLLAQLELVHLAQMERQQLLMEAHFHQLVRPVLLDIMGFLWILVLALLDALFAQQELGATEALNFAFRVIQARFLSLEVGIARCVHRIRSALRQDLRIIPVLVYVKAVQKEVQVPYLHRR